LRGRRPFIPHDVGPIGPDQKTPLEREMPLVNTLTHHCTSEAVAEDGVPIAHKDYLGHGEPLLASAVGVFLGPLGASNTGQGG
jgi:hypothetical protein